jgi:hypothetical protein
MSFRRLMGGAAIVALASVCAIEAQAQQISSSVRGVVTGPTGAPIPGAQVVITHSPSGTTSTATTTSGGSYFSSGLRVGGPYTISFSAAGFEAAELSDVFLAAGNPEPINATLRAQTTETIVVFGTRQETISLNNGVGSSFTSSDILNAPSTRRDLVSTLLRDPLANSNGGTGNLSIAGKNPRFSGLAIDGLLQGDDFGLSTSIYPTNRSPVSLDIVESAAVAASDYSVTASGFTGGLVNVVTKSGTNEFHGSLYYYRADEDFRGNVTDGTPVPQPAFLEEEYGGTIGGPIIPDRLFFFGSYDKFESGSGINFTGNDAGDDILDPTIFADIASVIQSGLGYDPGARPLSTSLPITTERYFGKIDWNITTDHRAAFTYQTSEETQTTVDNLSFDSSWYAAPIILDAYGAQLYSDWTDNLSTTLRASYKEFSRLQDCNAGRDVGAIEITLDPDDLIGTPAEGKLGDEHIFLAGCDRFRHGNTFEDTRLQLFGSANYIWNDHVITAGGEYEQYELDNLFVSDSLGTFRFDTLDEVEAATAATVTLRGAASGTGAAVWGFDKLTLFAQDEWLIAPNLTVNAGVRYERYVQDDKPPQRDDFETAYGRSNQENLDGLDILMPRFGFRYEPFDRTTISGGFGLFAGGDPKVWTSNAFSPQIFEASLSDVMGVDPSVIPPALAADIASRDPSSPSFIDTIAPGFEIPSDWKASVRVDQEFDLVFGNFDFGSDYVASAQLLVTQTKDNYHWVNLAQTDLGHDMGVAPDGRPIYPNLQALGVNNAVELSNVDGGESFIWSVSLSKDYENGFAFDVSYANQNVDSVTAGSSSRGVSNWRSTFDSDRNHPSEGRSEYEVEHKFAANLAYEREIFGDLMTRFDVFALATSGEPFSYTFNVSGNNTAALDNSLFGRAGNSEAPFDNDLLYVPATSGGVFNDPGVVFAPGFNQAAFAEYLGVGADSEGRIIDRNSDESTWNQRWDMRIQQDLPFANFGMSRFAGNRLKVVLDIENVANLLNDEWGTMYDGQGFDDSDIVVADLVTASDVALNGVAGATGLRGNAPAELCMTAGDCLYRYNSFTSRANSFKDQTDSVYRIRIGVRYEF